MFTTVWWSKRLLGWVYTQPLPVEMLKEVQYNRKNLIKNSPGLLVEVAPFSYIHSQR
jgi:hypothetical protein